MVTRLASLPATPGSLHPRVVGDLRLLLQFFADREILWRQQFGPRLKPTPLRDLLVRTVLLDFGEGKRPHVADYQRMLKGQVAAATIRNELRRFEDSGLIVVVPEAADRRQRAVLPTEKLVRFYNDVVPSLIEVLEEILARRRVQ